VKVAARFAETFIVESSAGLRARRTLFLLVSRYEKSGVDLIAPKNLIDGNRYLYAPFNSPFL